MLNGYVLNRYVLLVHDMIRRYLQKIPATKRLSGKSMIFAKLPPLFKTVTKCSAKTFDTVSGLRSPATAIQQNCSFATSQNAVPATRLDNAPAQSAAPATGKRHKYQ